MSDPFNDPAYKRKLRAARQEVKETPFVRFWRLLESTAGKSIKLGDAQEIWKRLQ